MSTSAISAATKRLMGMPHVYAQGEPRTKPMRFYLLLVNAMKKKRSVNRGGAILSGFKRFLPFTLCQKTSLPP